MDINSSQLDIIPVSEVLSELREGKFDYLTQIDDVYRHKFIAWAGKRFVVTPNDLEDAWQEALTLFYEKVVAGKIVTLSCSIGTYLFAVGGKHLMNLNRKMRRIIWEDDAGLALRGKRNLGHPLSEDTWEDERVLLSKAMTQMSEKCQKLLVFRHFDGYSIPEIKAMTEIASENAVSVHLFNCLENLKKIIRNSRLGKP